jgi:hypothetical protein
MKRFLLLAATGLLSVQSVAAQTTARGALAALTREKGAAIASQVVLVSGAQGQDQPESWRVVVRDPEFAGRFREYSIGRGKVIKVMPVAAQDAARLSRAPLVVKRIKIDSTTAFAAADHAARKALVGFDSLDYELRNKELSQDPVWLVRLIDSGGAAAGELSISAESGAVLRKTWYDTGRQPETAAQFAAHSATGKVSEPTRQPASAAVGQKAQQLWDGTRNGIEQGKEVMRTGFQRASTSVRGWIDRLRGEPGSSSDAAWENGTYDSSGH